MQKNDFSQGSLKRTIVSLSLPMIGAQLINVLYSIVDRVFIARIPGADSSVLAGVGITLPIITLVSAFAVLAGMGGSPLTSIERGQGNLRMAERIQGVCFALVLLFGVATTATGLLCKDWLLTAFGASGATFQSADAYISVYLLGSVFVTVTLGMNPFINAQGFARTGMYTVLIGAAANLALDPILIFACGMGVRGAALATVISQALSAAWTLLFLCGKKPILRLRARDVRLDGAIVRRVCALGFSNFTMRVTESAVQIVCNRQLGLFGGDLYIAVMTVINSIRQVIMMPLTGFSQGAQPVIGFNYGAKRYDRVREGVKFLTVACMVYAASAWALVELLPGPLMRAFSDDLAVLEAGVPAMRLYFAAFFAMCFQMAGQFSFVALGKAKQATFFSLLRKAFIVVPLTLLLPPVMGVNGVFLAELVSDLVGSTACFATFMLTVWRKELR